MSEFVTIRVPHHRSVFCINYQICLIKKQQIADHTLHQSSIVSCMSKVTGHQQDNQDSFPISGRHLSLCCHVQAGLKWLHCGVLGHRRALSFSTVWAHSWQNHLIKFTPLGTTEEYL